MSHKYLKSFVTPPKGVPKQKSVTKHPRTGGMRTLADFPYVNTECAARQDWIAGPTSQCRDSDNIEAANFDALCDRMDAADPYGTDWEIIRFGHFGVGWIDLIFARPSSACVAALGLAREQLQENPILDESRLAELEADDTASVDEVEYPLVTEDEAQYYAG